MVERILEKNKRICGVTAIQKKERNYSNSYTKLHCLIFMVEIRRYFPLDFYFKSHLTSCILLHSENEHIVWVENSLELLFSKGGAHFPGLFVRRGSSLKMSVYSRTYCI